MKLQSHPFHEKLGKWYIHIPVLGLVLYHFYLSVINSMGFVSDITNIFIAHWLTDLLSGILHFLTEYYPEENWQVENQKCMTAFHHTDVLIYSDFNFEDYLSIIHTAEILLIFIALFLTPGFSFHTIVTYLMIFSLFIFPSHCWAHERVNGFPLPPGVSFLQDICFLMQGRYHNKHHFENSSKYFGLFTGNSDWLTNLILVKDTKYDESFPPERMKEIGRLMNIRRESLPQGKKLDLYR